MAIQPEELAIPIIDLEPVRSGTPEQARQTGELVYKAFRDVGFAYIKNHGLPQELQDQAFEWVRRVRSLIILYCEARWC